MVPHPKTPILNLFYHLFWFYILTVSEFSCLAKSPHQAHPLALPHYNTPRGGNPDQRDALSNPPGHPQRPPAGEVHGILELPNRHRHGAPGR